MFNFRQPTVSPAVKSQLNAQFSFFTALSNQMLDGVQKINDLNVQVAKAVLEETLTSTQQLLTSKDQQEAISIVAGQSQPTAEKMRAYRQHIENILAETQVNIAKVVESRIPETTRAAEAVVKEVAQKASEETAKATQRQKEALEKLGTPITQTADKSVQRQ
jgi:phasin family protein